MELKYAVFAIVCLHVSHCMIFVTFVYLTDIVTIVLAVSLSHFLLRIHNTAIGHTHCLDAVVHGNRILLNNVTMYQCATVSVCHCINVPLYQCATVSMCHSSPIVILSHCNGSMLNSLSIACDTITICWLQPQHHHVHIPHELHTLYVVYGHPEILHVNKQT